MVCKHYLFLFIIPIIAKTNGIDDAIKAHSKLKNIANVISYGSWCPNFHPILKAFFIDKYKYFHPVDTNNI